MLRRLAPLSLPFFAVAALHAQAPAPYQFTIEDYARAERRLAPSVSPLVGGVAGRASWLPDGRAWYRVSAVGGGGSFVAVDPVNRTRAPLFDHARLAASLTPIVGTAVNPARLPFGTLTPEADGQAFTVTVGRKRIRCTFAADCTELPALPEAPANATRSPDGSVAVFIRHNNLWQRTLATGAEVQLTTDGIADFGYATDNAGWVHSDNAVLTWSPDGRRLATFQHDGRGTSEMVLAGTVPGAPVQQRWKYPLPGDSVIFRLHRVVIDLPAAGGPRVVRFDLPPDAHRSTVSDHVNCGGEVCDLQWYPDGAKVAFISSSRDHKEAWLRLADATTGAVRTVLHETSATQIGDASFPENLWRVLPATNELIWWSQRDNWTHLYLYNLATGQLKNRITTGEGNVTELVRVDEKTRQIWFLANGREPGRDPYFAHLYRIGFDGRGLTLLTPDAGHHSVTVAPDGKSFLDTWSAPDQPPVTVLRDAKGKQLLALEQADITKLLATRWKAPQRITVKARDGVTDLYGLMYTPSTLDSTRTYPIINHIYPGPQSGSVGPRLFLPARGDNQALAELGFVVVEIDGLGTPGRSKSFADYYYGRMNDNTIPDQVAGMRQLAQRYPFIDIENVGIWGHSGGGFATAAAMFQFPDFFKVGISESGNHDQRVYEDDWGERYQGLLVKTGDTDNYAAEANQTHAAKLKGKLFLIHGMLDDNVPPYNTQLVVESLMRAGKDFDQIMLPSARHGFGKDGPYIMRRRWDYFVQHLRKALPPKEYQMGRLQPAVP